MRWCLNISGQIVNRPKPITTKIPRKPFKGVSGSRGSKGSIGKAPTSIPKRTIVTTLASTHTLSKATILPRTPTPTTTLRIQKLTMTSSIYTNAPSFSNTTNPGIHFERHTTTSTTDLVTFKTGIDESNSLVKRNSLNFVAFMKLWL